MGISNELKKQKNELTQQLEVIDSAMQAKKDELQALDGANRSGRLGYSLDSDIRDLREQRLILASELQSVDLQIVNMQSSG